jgi:FkbM family methyltransferase
MADDIITVDTAEYGPICGLAADEVILPTVAAGALWEPYLVALFDKLIRPGSNAIDVGANIGLHSIAMAVRQPDVEHVWSFEAHPEIFPCLFANAKRYPKILAHRSALGETERFASMRVLDRSSNPGGARVFPNGQGQYTIEVLTLDALNLRNVSLIKIDVEGGEMGVIEGGRRTIQRDKPTLIVEIVGDDPLLPDAARARDHKIQKIKALGYRAENITPDDLLFTPL